MILAALILALAAIEGARADCPTTTITTQISPGSVTHTTTLPRDSLAQGFSASSCSDFGCIYNSGRANAIYDLVAGTLEVYASALGVSYSTASVAAHDVYTLIGPGSGPPIMFHAHAHGGVALGCVFGPSGGADASIREGASNIASVSAQGFGQNCFVPSYDIEVAITLAPGSTFDLYLSVDAHGVGGLGGSSGDGWAQMSLGFPDLPAGYSVVSCQGFGGGQVTPARRTSWGELKTRYR